MLNYVSVNLDASQRVYNKEGMENFFYPISRRAHLDFSIDMMKIYCDVVSNHQDNKDIDLYKILAKYYISGVIGIFQGLYLKSGLDTHKCDYQVPLNWRLWPALLEGKRPQIPAYVERFRRGPAQTSYTKKVFDLNFLKQVIKKISLRSGGMNIDGLKIKPITLEVLKNDIIATQRTPMIVKHTGEVEGDVVFCRSVKWFSGIDLQDGSCTIDHALSPIDRDLISQTKTVFSKYGVKLPENLVIYFEDIIKQSIPYFNNYLDVLVNINSLPKRLWVGTSGDIWDCLLKVAVKRAGGYVCGHDHGTGQGHLSTPIMGIVELWGCDEFYTFSSELAAAAPNWSLLDGKLINIIISKNKETFSKNYFERKRIDIKNIFLLSTVYDKDRGRMHPLVPDILQLDWQARFIGFLKREGYNVTIKAHPESAFPTPQSFETVLGAKINSERFEEVFKAADLFVFDYVCTSTFKEALNTNIPVIIVDFDDVVWTEKARSLIEKRCAFVKGRYDENNRLQIDWDDFDNAIQTAQVRSSNTEFYDYYY